MNQNQKPKIYIAGPQVFLPDAAAFFSWVVKFCEAQGLEALVPLDPPVEGVPDPTSLEIFERNLAKIRNCDGVVACVDYFRGTEPDSGTCMEIGYAKALSKPIVTYCFDSEEVETRTLDYFVQIGELKEDEVVHPDFVYPDGMKAEAFGHRFNLMIKHSADHVGGNVDSAIVRLKQILTNLKWAVEEPAESGDLEKALLAEHPHLDQMLTIYQARLEEYPEDSFFRKASPTREKLLELLAQLHHDKTEVYLTPGKGITISEYMNDKKSVLMDIEEMPNMVAGHIFGSLRDLYNHVI